MTAVEAFSALTVPLRVEVVAVVPLAALVVAAGAEADVVKLVGVPKTVPALLTASMLNQ